MDSCHGESRRVKRMASVNDSAGRKKSGTDSALRTGELNLWSTVVETSVSAVSTSRQRN